MTFTGPMFWYHQGQRAHQLPDARSDVKGRTLLRRVRKGYAAITPPRTPEGRQQETTEAPSEAASEAETPEEEPAAEEQDPFPDPPEEELAAELAAEEQTSFPDPPEYVFDQPPPYAQPTLLTPPGYTAIPAADEPARDLKLPFQRRRYRDALRRRLTSTKKRLSMGGSDSTGSDAEYLEEEESARGVVLYREDDHWVGTTDMSKFDGQVTPRQRGFKAWVKRAWARLMVFSEEHPYLFILAVFVIVIVVMCILI